MKAALVGAGRIAQQHLACLSRLPGVELVGICDSSRVAAEAAAEQYRARAWYTDYEEMLAVARPDVVHVTTPAQSHFRLALDALEADAHVFVEKPAAVTWAEALKLVEHAEAVGKTVVEDYNYLFNRPVRSLLDTVRSGAAGEVVHVAITLCLDLLRPGNPFADPNLLHPSTSLPGGAVADFLPHLASLAHAFLGPHRRASSVWMARKPSTTLRFDEMRALVESPTATASLCFSTHTQPDVFTVEVFTTAMRARASLFEPRLAIDRLRPLPKPLVPLVNGLQEAVTVGWSALAGLSGKLSGGPGSYEGVWELITQTYGALSAGLPPPVRLQDVAEVNRLAHDLLDQVEHR